MSELERVAAKASGEGKLQRRFRSLLAKVDGLKDRVRMWRDARPELDRELAAYRAVVAERSRLECELAVRLDDAYGSDALGKSDRKRLKEIVLELSGRLIAAGYTEMKAIYDRHSPRRFDAERADEAARLRRRLERQGFAFEEKEIEVESVDRVKELAWEQIGRARAANAERRAKRRLSVNQLARVEDQRSAQKAVQDVYRALAMQLHPDRELDTAERDRKAELMRAVNIAYEANDLLRLLELQSGDEVIHEERVTRYNRILDEQVRALTAELEAIERPWRMRIGIDERTPIEPASVGARIRHDAETARAEIERLQGELAEVGDWQWLMKWLREQTARQVPGTGDGSSGGVARSARAVARKR